MKARIPPGPWNQPLTGGLRERRESLARNDSVLRVKTTAYAQALPFRHEIPLWRPRWRKALAWYSVSGRSPVVPSCATAVAKGSRLVLRFGPLVVPSCVYRPFNPQCVSSSGDAAFATNAPKLRYQHREQPDVTRFDPSETRSLRNCSPHSDTLGSVTVLLNNVIRASAMDSGSEPCAPSKLPRGKRETGSRAESVRTVRSGVYLRLRLPSADRTVHRASSPRDPKGKKT